MVVSWVYGIGNFLDNIEEMGVRFGGKIMKTIVKFVYLIVTPGILIVVVIIAWMGRGKIRNIRSTRKCILTELID